MLVTMASNVTVGANASQTFTYSPKSVQKVLVRLDDINWKEGLITIQIGSVTICNSISVWGLAGLGGLQYNFDPSGSQEREGLIAIDLGSHQCTERDNLYVTVQAGANDLSATDVSAIVDEGGQFPLRLTQYSDNTFVSPSNLMAISYDSAFQETENDYVNVEIRTPVQASSPSFVSASNYYSSCAISNYAHRYFGLLNKNPVPLETSYNYASGSITDTILTVEQMPSTASQVAQAKTSDKIVASQASI